MGRVESDHHDRCIRECNFVQRRPLEVGRVKCSRHESRVLGAAVFNDDLSKWDVSSVTRMVSMFMRAASFDGDISRWDVSTVTSTSSVFNDATAFNGDISKWDVHIYIYICMHTI